MPRRTRYAPAGCAFHVTNRRIERRQLFFNDADYRGFLRLLAIGKKRHAIKVFGLCLMPNHFHAMVQPESDSALSAYFHWVQGCYACDFRSRTQTIGTGHVFQQRFWSEPILDVYHFRNVLRYIEANPIAAKLVERAEQWRWGSLHLRADVADRLLDALPVQLPARWPDVVNEERLPDEGD